MNAKIVLWSEVTPTAMSEGTCLLIMNKPELVFALRFLQGYAEQHSICSTRKAKQPACILFGKVADVHECLKKKSAAGLCQAYGLQLKAAYSTSKPRCKR